MVRALYEAMLTTAVVDKYKVNLQLMQMRIIVVDRVDKIKVII
jgi:hypothetical protein